MAIKTDGYGWDDDDYVQEDGGLRELTVTITLAEYRRLIEAKAELLAESESCDMAAQVESQRAQLDILGRICASSAAVQDLLRDLGQRIAQFYADTQATREDAEGDKEVEADG